MADSGIDNSPIKRVVMVDVAGTPVYVAQGSSFNDVDVTNLPTTVDTNSGNKSASTLRVTLATDQVQLTNALKVEQQFSYSRNTADGQVKATAGFLHSVIVTPTAATSTAGVITIYDSAAESGTVILTVNIATNNATNYVFPLDVVCGTGIYIGYDGTVTNHAVTVAYR